MINILEELRLHNNAQKKTPDIKSGDILTLTVTQYKNKKKKQTIKGLCLGIRKQMFGSTIRIRNIIAGEAVEQTFLLQSPILSAIEVTGKIDSRSSKSYYLRNKSSSKSKIG